jgi:hypothetical protein
MCFTRVGSGLTQNIRLGWKDLPGTNSLAYYKNQYITAVNRFYKAGPPCYLFHTLVLRNAAPSGCAFLLSAHDVIKTFFSSSQAVGPK